jgi:hypothetical protein
MKLATLYNSFSNKKRLRFIITLSNGKFGSSSNNIITLEGFRASAQITLAGGDQNGTLDARIYGVSQSDMNACTSLAWNNANVNTVQIFAIDGSQETLVFSGNIVNCWGDYQSMPDVFLYIQANAGFLAKITPANPTSYNGTVDVATAFSQLVKNMSQTTSPGLTFVNNGVNQQLRNVYLTGSWLDQAYELKKAAHVEMYYQNNVLTICPRGIPLTDSLVPVISSKTGMIGYPTFDGQGINLRTLFNPAISQGHLVKVISPELSTNAMQVKATGIWIVNSMDTILESETPDGQWFSTLRLQPNGSQ